MAALGLHTGQEAHGLGHREYDSNRGRPQRAAPTVRSEFFNLFQLEAADSVFADAAEVEGVVVFDDVGDLGEAVGWTVLEVFDDFALGV